MQIRSIRVNNFKSLVDFEITFSKLTCLIGLNGAGKSTVLQFVDFLSHLVRGDVIGWLEERQWKPGDVRSKLLKRNIVEFSVHFQHDNGKPAGCWQAHYNPRQLRCTWEKLEIGEDKLKVEADEVTVVDSSAGEPVSTTSLTFDYEGSVLSALREKLLPEALINFKAFFRGTESLDTLTPERLRQRTRAANGSLGHGGRNLSAFVYELGVEGRKALVKQLKRAYPSLRQVNSTSLRSGWKQLQAMESFKGTPLLTESRHLNDGMLRLIAILAEVRSTHDLLLFDEIENGINPELVEFVLNDIVNSRQQVVVTTHSPMILNYLDDDIAAQSVVYIYKTVEGHTKSLPFFSIPSLKKKLSVMGPGEAFVDTDLVALAEEINDMEKANA